MTIYKEVDVKELLKVIMSELESNPNAKKEYGQWVIGDGYTDALAFCSIDENSMSYRTAWSHFVYAADIETGLLVYEGAYNGLSAQEILPECLKKMDWKHADVESSLGEYIYEDYVELRKQLSQLKMELYNRFGDKGTGVMEGIEATDVQLGDVFENYNPWTYDIEKVKGDPINEQTEDKNSKDYLWFKLTFEIDKGEGQLVTPFTLWVRRKKGSHETLVADLKKADTGEDTNVPGWEITPKTFRHLVQKSGLEVADYEYLPHEKGEIWQFCEFYVWDGKDSKRYLTRTAW